MSISEIVIVGIAASLLISYLVLAVLLYWEDNKK